MIAAVLSLTLLGVFCGWLLGLAARYLRVETNPLNEELQQLLPGVNCGQCGFPGCAGAAEALASGKAPRHSLPTRRSAAGASAGGQTGRDGRCGVGSALARPYQRGDVHRLRPLRPALPD